MPGPSTFRDVLTEVGYAICLELVRLMNERGRYPLRPNSDLARQLLSPEAVQVTQQRGAGGRFGALGLTIIAQDYLQWIDTGRRPGARKVPIQAILQFIKNRNLRPRDKASGRYVKQRKSTLKGRDGAPGVTVNQLAFAIQNAIFKNGIKGRHMIAPAWEMGNALLSDLLDENSLDAMTADLDAQFQYFTPSRP